MSLQEHTKNDNFLSFELSMYCTVHVHLHLQKNDTSQIPLVITSETGMPEKYRNRPKIEQVITFQVSLKLHYASGGRARPDGS